jgi:hypothetical protein
MGETPRATLRRRWHPNVVAGGVAAATAGAGALAIGWPGYGWSGLPVWLACAACAGFAASGST